MQVKIGFFIFLLAFSACKSKGRKSNVESSAAETKDSISEQSQAGRSPIMVYKTKADYNALVPVILNSEKTGIISYPQASDLLLDSAYATPILLNEGYLLDRRGINENVAFLNISYSSYANQKSLPRLDLLLRNIIDNDPLTELCNCSQLNKDSLLLDRLNEMIKNKTLRNQCRVIK